MSRQEPKTDGDVPDRPVRKADDSAADAKRPREVGGRNGPEPTRYGDWEKAGRCIDF